MTSITGGVLSTIIISLLNLLLGGGAAAAWVAFRKDKRLGKKEDFDLFAEMKKMAADEIKSTREEIAGLKKEVARDKKRMYQLEQVIRSLGGVVPPWATEEEAA